MKSIILLSAAIVLTMLSSCLRYQYVYLNSNLPKNDQKEFIQENDTLRVQYSFAGQNCPITINVFNKFSYPLYVDWKKSSVIVNEEVITLWENQSEAEDSKTDDHISFIPPQSSIQISPLYMINKFIEFAPEDKFVKASYMTDNGAIRMKRYYYSINDSPFNFRCFLSYSTEKDFSSEYFSENAFWISDIVPTFSRLPLDQPDNFYLQKSTGFSTFVGVTALAGLIVLGASMPDTGGEY